MTYMNAEQDRSADFPSQARALVEKLVTAENVLQPGNGYREDEVERSKQELVGLKQEANQMILSIGNKCFPAIFGKLDELEQKDKEQFDSEVHEYCLAGSMDSQMGDFYDNAVSASCIGLRHKLDAIESVRIFFQQLQTPPQRSTLK